MTGASEDLLQAVYGLRKAAEAQFTGNAYYQVAHEINELIELVGWGDGSTLPGQDAVLGFATMLDEIRKLAKTNTSGSLYSAILYKLDGLAAFMKTAEGAPAPVSEKPAPAAAPVPAPVQAVPAAPEPAPAAAPAKAPAGPAVPEELLQAAYGLRKAAEAQFTGNAYYQAVNEIDNLIECLGWGDSKIRPGDGAAYGFATMIAEMRKLAKAHTSGNQYYAIVVKLDRLESQLAPAARPAEKPVQAAPAAPAPVAAPVPVAAPAPAAAPAPSAANPTFAALSAASKARVEQVAASLGIVPSHHAAPHQETEAPAAADWEKRSSEPCAMAELAPVAAAPAAHPGSEPHIEGSPHGEGAHGSAGAVCPFHAMFAIPAGEPASAPVEAASGKSFDELAAASKAQVEHTAVSLGIAAPHTVIAPEAVEALSDRRLESRSSGNTSTSSPEGGSGDNLEAATGQAAPEPRVAEAAPDLGSPAAQGEVLAAEELVVAEVAEAAEAPPPAAQMDEAVRPVEIKRSEPKTLFRLWLDLAFGRKD